MGIKKEMVVIESDIFHFRCKSHDDPDKNNRGRLPLNLEEAEFVTQTQESSY